MKYGIVVDSSCDLPALRTGGDSIDYTKVPLKLDIGDKEFVDDETLDVPAFIEELYAYKGRSGSAAPAPYAFLEAYEKSECVFAITITSQLSGSYASAMTAADMFLEEHPERKIYVIDSRSTGPEMSMIANRLAELIGEGKSFEEICRAIEEYRRRTYLLYALQSIENLVKNGRVSRLAGSIAGILGIKVLGVASENGTVELLHKLRGRLSVYDKMIVEMLERGYNGGRVIIAHCLNPEMAGYLAREILSRFPKSSVEMMPSGGLCSYYAERGGILLGFEGRPREA